MHARYRIEITRPSDISLVDRLRNLGEELRSSLGSKAHVDMNEVDAATEFFWVHVSDKRNIGDVATIIKKQLAHSGLDGVFSATRVRE